MTGPARPRHDDRAALLVLLLAGLVGLGALLAGAADQELDPTAWPQVCRVEHPEDLDR